MHALLHEQGGMTFEAKRSPIKSLQMMRAVAALAVVLYHTHLILSKPTYGAIEAFANVAGKGWTGVNFFFVLSGFIICFAHLSDIDVPRQLPRYAWRRFVRVYPIYWIALTIYIGAAMAGLGGDGNLDRSIPNLSAAYSLVAVVPAPTLPLQVAWTLFYEVQFYVAFGLLILSRRIGSIVIATWIVVILFNATAFGPGDRLWIVHVWNLYFLVGALGFLAYQRLPASAGPWLLAVGLLLLVAAMASGIVANRIAETQREPLLLLALSIPFVMILLGGALSERRFGWAPPQLFMLLGNASYAIYLIHSPVISACAAIIRRFGQHGLPAQAIYLAVFALATIAGVAMHLIVEQPLLDVLRRRRRPAPLAVPT